MLVLIYEFAFDKEVVPEPSNQFSEADYFNFTGSSIVETFPFVIFLFLYQPNIPLTYFELANRSKETMNTVISRANIIAVACFLIVGTTGYLIFADVAEE